MTFKNPQMIKGILATTLAFMLFCATGISSLAMESDANEMPKNNIPESNISESNMPESETSVANDIEEPAAAFHMQLAIMGNGPKLRGYFTGYTPGMRNIQSQYSLDGEHYEPVQEDYWMFSHELLGNHTPENTVANADQSPLKEYLEKSIDTFFIRLHYETDTGEKVSQAVQFSRPTESIPFPEDMGIMNLYPKNMQTNRIGQYNLTVRSGATRDEVLAMLPGKLPVELQVFDSGFNFLMQTFGEGITEWNLPNTLSEEHSILENAVTSFTMPEDFQLETFYELYSLQKPITPTMPLTLNLNWVDNDAKVDFFLHMVEDGLDNYPAGTLFIDFPLKPSGAEAIIPSYSLDNGETWTTIDDLLLHNQAIDAFPKNCGYEYVALFSPDQSPYKEYLAGELDGFLVKLDIVGGTFSGQSEAVAWPTNYQYQPPDKDNGDNGSGGNENNAGSGNNSDDGTSNGGYHPSIPDENKPSVPPEQAITPEQPQPEQPITSEQPQQAKPVEVDPIVSHAQVATSHTQEEPSHQAQNQGENLDTIITTPWETDLSKSNSEKDRKDRLPIGLTMSVILIGTVGTIAVAGSGNAAAVATNIISKVLGALKKIFLRR